MIPDEAVEAAAMAILAVDPATWALQSPGTKDRYRWDAQAALEAAAPHLMAPRVVGTVEELDALPEGTIVQAGYQYYWLEASRHDVAWWVIFNEQHYFRSADLELPATVIHDPEHGRSAGAGE